ncbi:MAG: response regulator transcription factor [Chloroflexi bacterium]|nr:response regulator transcription factor [Chloroflexota bacterium]
MIRLVVVDDHPVVRHGLVSMLRYEKDMQVVGEAGDGAQAVRVILEQKPDVVLLDLRLPQLSGIEVMKQVRSQQEQLRAQQAPLQAQAADIRFLVLTTYDTDEYIVPALSAGAQGYLLKDTTPDELTRAIRSLAAGGAPLEPAVAAKLIESMSGKDEDELSARELDVLKLLVAGASNKMIAAQLNLSENTIKSHLSHIFSKLQVQSRAEAVAAALQRGIVPLDRS